MGRGSFGSSDGDGDFDGDSIICFQLFFFFSFRTFFFFLTRAVSSDTRNFKSLAVLNPS